MESEHRQGQQRRQEEGQASQEDKLLDLELERLQDMMAEIPCEDVCLHFPDSLEYEDTEWHANSIHVIYRCKCGARVKEIFRHTDTHTILSETAVSGQI